MKTKIQKIFSALFIWIIFFTNIWFTYASFYISVDNSFAWKSTFIKTSNIWENISGRISVEKPNWEKIFINENSWKDSKINSEILWYHTKKTWKYNVEINLENWDSAETNFFVYPWRFSLSKSKIYASEKSIAAKIDKTDIFAKIVDRYWNAIKWQKIKLLSSREDDIFDSDCKTDKKWICDWKIKSKTEWKSIFTAINLSENKVLNQRVKVIFYTAEEKFAVWWNPYLSSLLDVDSWDNLLNQTDSEFWVIDWFKIETSDKVVLNSDDNIMKIYAVDKDWNVIKDYLWDIQIIIPNDENAVLPWNWKYSFVKEDQWSHEFSLSTVFTRAWKNKIEVYEIDNW